MIYQTEKALKDYGDKISADERGRIESALQELKDALANSNATAEELKSKTEKVQQASMELGQKVYEAAQQNAGQQGGNAGAGASGSSQGAASSDKNDDGTMDASYEEVK